VKLLVVNKLLKRALKLFYSGLLLLLSIQAKSQLIVGEVDPYILVTNVLVGNGIKTSNISFTGYKRSIGFFENGATTKLQMDAGVILSTGLAVGVQGPNNVGDKTTAEFGSKAPGSFLLDQYATGTTYDAATLQFDFIPQTEEIVFNYIFASEEYIEYVDKNVSDIFGFFISGPGIVGEQNVALVPGTSLPVSIDNVNHLRNSQYFKLNTIGEKTLQADGYTTILTAKLNLIPCQTYTIKLALADVGDDLLDSYVFIQAGSFKHKTSIGNDTFICNTGFDIELDAGNPTRQVRWSTGDTTHKIRVKDYGEYWVEVFTDCGSFKDYKKVLPGVNPIDLGKDTVYCGDSFTRKLEILNRKFDTYKWSDGSTDEFLIAKKSGLYWLEVDKGGCKRRDSIFLTLEPNPVIGFGKDTIICGTIDMTLGPKQTAKSYLWNTGDTSYRIRITKAGTYSVLVNGVYCYNRDTVSILSRKPVSFNLGNHRLEICQNDTVRLYTGIRDTFNYETRWNTGSHNPAILVSQSGRYKVVVRDKLCNFLATDSVDVFAYQGDGNIWVANAFTPDNNGVNDIFKPVSDIAFFNHYSFRVFDRWGQKLYETTDPNAGWDGYYKGELSKNDVYIWTLYFKSNCSKGDNNFMRGSIHLIR
jgi:gliding motility-associated-like protein